MGGGEVLRKGWLIKSPPLDSGGIKVSLAVPSKLAYSTS